MSSEGILTACINLIMPSFLSCFARSTNLFEVTALLVIQEHDPKNAADGGHGHPLKRQI